MCRRRSTGSVTWRSSSRTGSRSRRVPDDVLGHAAIRAAVAPIGVATGEHGMNRVLFKQMFQAEAIDFCQLDSARLAQHQRDSLRLPHGEEVRRSGLPARRRRWTVRTGAAPVDLRLRRRFRGHSRIASPSTSITCTSTSSTRASSRAAHTCCRASPATARSSSTSPSPSTRSRPGPTGLRRSQADPARSPRPQADDDP